MGKSFKYYFGEKQVNVKGDTLYIQHKVEYVIIFFSIKMESSNIQYNHKYSERDSLRIRLTCKLLLDKKDNLFINFNDLIKEATEQDYIKCLLDLNNWLIDTEATEIKMHLGAKNKRIEQHQSIIEKEKAKIEIIEKHYPIHLL